MIRARTDGFVAPGFELVRSEFERNFAERGELGAACAAYRGGEKVVDLWGGVRDARTGAPWAQDTLVLVYSTSKGLAAMTLALAHSRGRLDYDERVAAYWPEFAQAGKDRVTVRQLLGHEAGLPVIDEPLDVGLLQDFDRLAAVIARQRPLWEPGTRHGYHGVSLGWYEGELIRRLDPAGRTLGRVFAEDIAAPLGLEVHFGVPASVGDERLARIERATPMRALAGLRHMPPRMALAMGNPRSVTFRTFANPRLRSPADLDRREYRRVEFPAGGAVGGARDIARAYAAFAAREPELGLSPATLEELTRFPQPPSRGWRDEVLKVNTAFSLGYARPLGPFRFGSSQRAFGHPGAGGSFAFADPEREVAFAYVMNRLGFHLRDDPREYALRRALYSCLADTKRAT
ncbi:MAG TPA: serine hydrolase domain-containing protein, partial [Solirubrobacteraceae bacterium]|nr:serine hydrolase domain-containing protein [Solirubrobacteraceae bacterium]